MPQPRRGRDVSRDQAQQQPWFALHCRCVLQDSPLRKRIERELVRWAACTWVASWSGVIKYHGPRPTPCPNHVWVANHSSMIDYTILTALMPFAAIMQLHPGWVGFLQKRILTCLGCLWFQRSEVRIMTHDGSFHRCISCTMLGTGAYACSSNCWKSTRRSP
jgi:hypothetical protein